MFRVFFGDDNHAQLYIYTYILGGGFKYVFFHSENWGRFPIWRSYFSKGLVQPPTGIYIYIYMGMIIINPCQVGFLPYFSPQPSNASGRRHRGKEVPDAADPPTPAKTLQRLELLVPDEVMGDKLGWWWWFLPRGVVSSPPPQKKHTSGVPKSYVFCCDSFVRRTWGKNNTALVW